MKSIFSVFLFEYLYDLKFNWINVNMSDVDTTSNSAKGLPVTSRKRKANETSSKLGMLETEQDKVSKDTKISDRQVGRMSLR